MNPLEGLMVVCISGVLMVSATAGLQSVAGSVDTSGLNPVSDCMRGVLSDAGLGVMDAIAGIRDGDLDPLVRQQLDGCAYVITGDPNDPWAGVPDDLLEDLGVQR